MAAVQWALFVFLENTGKVGEVYRGSNGLKQRDFRGLQCSTQRDFRGSNA